MITETDKTNVEIVLTHLAALGDTADKVAAKLKEKGIKGACGIAHECPLAEYFKPLCDADLYVGATHTMLRVGQYAIRAPKTPNVPFYGVYPELIVAPNNAIFDFIRRFDAGLYPELVKENSYG